MLNQQLLDYIKQQLATGLDKQAVKDALLSVGWSEQDINEAFDFYFTSSYLPQQSPAQPVVPNQTSAAGPAAESSFESTFLGPVKLLSNAWALYKQRFWTLITVALIPMLVIIAATIGSSWVSAFIFSKIITGSFLSLILMLVLVGLAIFWVQLWGQTALLFAIVNHKESIGFVESYRRGWHKIFSLWWIITLMVFVTLGGFLLAIIPGVIFTIWFSLSAIVLIAEDSRGMNALLKSREYVRGRWRDVLRRNIFVGLLGFIIYIIPTLLFSFVFKIPVVLQVVHFIVLITWTPLVLAYSFLIYQNLKSLRDEIDLAVNKKSRTAFIIIALLGIVAIPALFFWMIFPTFSTLRQLGKTPSIGSYSPTISPSTDETANWQTYRNEKYRFEIKYPADHTPYEKTDQQKETLIPATSASERVAIAEPEAFLFCCEALVLDISIAHENINPQEWLDQNYQKYSAKAKIKSTKNVIFAGENALEIIGGSNIGSTYRLLIIKRSDYLIVINQNSKSEFLDSILSTFKFIP